jgi:hypothetical protein
MTVKVLIVEDKPLLADTYTVLFEDAFGCIALTAASSSQAISLLETPIGFAAQGGSRRAA